MTQGLLPTPERRAKFLIDTARAWQEHGRPDQAYRALLAAEANAPEEIRRASVKALIATIAQSRGTSLAGLRGLANRSGTQMPGG